MRGRGKFGFKVKTLLAMKDSWCTSSLFHVRVFVWNFVWNQLLFDMLAHSLF